MAGSENVGRSGAVDKRLREAGMNSECNRINKHTPYLANIY